MTGTLSYSGRLTVTKCWCGTAHAVPEELYNFQRQQFDDGVHPKGIYCPLGHVWAPSGEPEVEKVRRERDLARDRTAIARSERDQAEASRRAQKAATTRLKKRVGAGICPCCKRTVKQLAAHMKSKHPDYTSKENAA